MTQPTPTPPPAPIVGDYTLPSGVVVTFADPEDLTGDDVQAVMDTLNMSADDLTGGALRLTAGAGMRFAATVAARLIVSWQVPYLPDAPAPATDPTQLGRLKAKDYAAALSAAAPALQLFMGDTVTVDDATVPGSPTEPASA